MRVITWNMGCAFQNSKYRKFHEEAWSEIDSLEPDIAFLQEVSRIPPGIDPAKIAGAPRNGGAGFQTVVYARNGSLTRLETDPDLAAVVLGQAIIAELFGAWSETFVVASVHTLTGPPKPWQAQAFEGLSPGARARLPEDKGSWNAHVILEAVSRASTGRRLIVGGDFNAAWRFDETSGRPYWASDQFRAMRDRGWRRPHLRFHAGEERTLFRKQDEIFQLDHFFVDEHTYRESTRCDVVHLDHQERLSDHAPLILEIAGV